MQSDPECTAFFPECFPAPARLRSLPPAPLQQPSCRLPVPRSGRDYFWSGGLIPGALSGSLLLFRSPDPAFRPWPERSGPCCTGPASASRGPCCPLCTRMLSLPSKRSAPYTLPAGGYSSYLKAGNPRIPRPSESQSECAPFRPGLRGNALPLQRHPPESFWLLGYNPAFRLKPHHFPAQSAAGSYRSALLP